MVNLTMWNFLEVLYINNVEGFGVASREYLEHYKHKLIGNSGGSLEDRKVEKSMDSEGQAHEVLEVNKDFWEWDKSNSCYILEKNPATFCLCTESLKEDFSKNILRICLVETSS